jgi:hypothetical protein
MRYFFYGTLMDAELLSVVLGRELPASALHPATLASYRRCHVRGEAFPILVADVVGTVVGVLADGLSELDARRIAWYESDDYEIREIEARLPEGEAVSAFCCLPRPGARHDGTPWDFERWRQRDRAFALALARDWMDCFGRADVDLAERNYWRRKRRLLAAGRPESEP